MAAVVLFTPVIWNNPSFVLLHSSDQYIQDILLYSSGSIYSNTSFCFCVCSFCYAFVLFCVCFFNLQARSKIANNFWSNLAWRAVACIRYRPQMARSHSGEAEYLQFKQRASVSLRNIHSLPQVLVQGWSHVDSGLQDHWRKHVKKY